MLSPAEPVEEQILSKGPCTGSCIELPPSTAVDIAGTISFPFFIFFPTIKSVYLRVVTFFVEIKLRAKERVATSGVEMEWTPI